VSGEGRQESGRLSGAAPPVNLDLEQALLGILLVKNSAYEAVADVCRYWHFADDRHARLYRVIAEMIDDGRLANPITIKSQFERDEALAKLGGVKYLIDLAGAPIPLIGARDYALQIRDLWFRRELMEIAASMYEQAATFEFNQPAASIVELAEAEFLRLSEDGDTGTESVSQVEVTTRVIHKIQEAIKAGGRLTGLSWGIPSLDEETGGMQDGELIVVGARPGQGKTAFAGTVTRSVASGLLDEARRENRRVPRAVAFFSQEMSAEQLTMRDLAAGTGIAVQRQVRGQVSEEEFYQLDAERKRIAGMPIEVFDRGRVSVTFIRQKARRIARKRGLALIVVDHLQLIRQIGKQEARRLEIGDATSALKALAKELGVPVLLLSQLGRDVDKRENKRPVLADLRESGDIEADADVVVFLYREIYYLAREEPVRKQDESDPDFNERWHRWSQRCSDIAHLAEVILAKVRQGEIKTIKLAFDGARMRFNDLIGGSQT
jgi:replicative DNA helicase